MSANDIQIGGAHYQRGGEQHWDFAARYNIPYLLAVPVKYLTRWRDKGGVEDLRKARHFVQKTQEVLTGSLGEEAALSLKYYGEPPVGAVQKYLIDNGLASEEEPLGRLEAGAIRALLHLNLRLAEEVLETLIRNA